MRESDGGTILRIEVVPGAATSHWAGYDEWRKAMKVRIAAQPRGGKANDELLGFVADSLGLPKKSVILISGGRSRQKELLLSGIDISSLLKRLERA